MTLPLLAAMAAALCTTVIMTSRRRTMNWIRAVAYVLLGAAVGLLVATAVRHGPALMALLAPQAGGVS